jgi:hypothetical protein
MSDISDPSATHAEPEDVLAAVRADIDLVLGELFTPSGSFEIQDLPDGSAVLPRSDDESSSVAVLWTWSGVHDRPTQGVTATGAEVSVEGVTIASGRPGDRSYRRFIDWSDVWSQIGLSIGTRPGIPVT